MVDIARPKTPRRRIATPAPLRTHMGRRDAYSRELARAKALEAAFLRRHGVSEFYNGRHNLGRILRSGGAEASRVSRVLNLIGEHALSGPFDHGRVFGRDGVPLLIVGHPYSLEREDMRLLKSLQSLGLGVYLGNRSFYGFDTLQVLVTSAGYEANPVRRFIPSEADR